jgi:hypothetical protein
MGLSENAGDPPMNNAKCSSGSHDESIFHRENDYLSPNSIYPLVMTNIAMEAMAHRNSWFLWV